MKKKVRIPNRRPSNRVGADLLEVIPDATVSDGLAIRGNDCQNDGRMCDDICVKLVKQ